MIEYLATPDINLFMSMKVGSRSFMTYELAETADATPPQLKVRESWLKR